MRPGGSDRGLEAQIEAWRLRSRPEGSDRGLRGFGREGPQRCPAEGNRGESRKTQEIAHKPWEIAHEPWEIAGKPWEPAPKLRSPDTEFPKVAQSDP